MATIVIKDLPDNLDLDRKAMQAITGGSRLRSQVRVTGRTAPRQQRLVDFRTGIEPHNMAPKKTR